MKACQSGSRHQIDPNIVNIIINYIILAFFLHLLCILEPIRGFLKIYLTFTDKEKSSRNWLV